MDKERFNDALMGYLYGELTPREEEVFLAHCRANPDAMAELNALGGVRKVVANAAPLPDPPSAITARILDAGRQAVPSAGSAASQKVAAGAGPKAAPGGIWAWLSKPWAWGVAVAGAGATAVVLLGVPTLRKVEPALRQEAASPKAAPITSPAKEQADPAKTLEAAAAPRADQYKAKLALAETAEAADSEGGGAGDAPRGNGIGTPAGGGKMEGRMRGARKGGGTAAPADDANLDRGTLGRLQAEPPENAKAKPRPVEERPQVQEKKQDARLADATTGADKKPADQPWGVRASQDEAAEKEPAAFNDVDVGAAKKKTVTMQMAQAPAKEAPPSPKAAEPQPAPPATAAPAPADNKNLAVAPRPTGSTTSPLALPSRNQVLSKDARTEASARPAQDPAPGGGGGGSAGNVAAGPAPQAPAASPAMAPPPPAQPTPMARPMANKPAAATKADGDAMAGEEDALTLPRAKRERDGVPAERRAVMEEMKKVKRADSSMKAQTEMAAAADLLASGDASGALGLFRKAESLDVNGELAPNPRAGQAVAMARLKQCQQALTVARGIARQYPRFTRLGGTLEEIATCYEKARDTRMAVSLRKEADVLNGKLAKTADPAALANRAAQVNQQLRGDQRMVQGCEMAGTSAGELPQAAGAWTVSVTLNAEGSPTQVTARGPRPAPATQACLESLVRAQTFARSDLPSQKVDVRLMLQARAAGGAGAAAKSRSKQEAPAAEMESQEAR